MSDDATIELARLRLVREPHQSPTRVLGYANRHILRVDHLPGHAPDQIIHDIDPAARRLRTPPTEDHSAAIREKEAVDSLRTAEDND